MKKLIFLLLLGCSAPIFAELSQYQQCLFEHGFDSLITTNESTSADIILNRPTCAYVNIDGIDDFPQTKVADSQAWLEWYDPTNDVYFKKRIILNAQGNSSMAAPKKNGAIDFCEDEWIGDETTQITIGDWVAQDSYHIKAYYADWLRGVGAVGYWIYDDIVLDHDTYLERAGIEDYKTGARCYPDGFPCIVYLNGNFYGIYAWQLKKDRDNMGMKKKEAMHIHLDGEVSDAYFWNGTIDWTKFEIRNPKNLYCVTVTAKGKYAKYDGEQPCELIDETMPLYDPTNEDHVRTAQVKHAIENLSQCYTKIAQLPDQERRQAIADHLDVTSLMDYIVLDRVVNNYDGTWGKNWQWFTYNGAKWFVAPYDLDGTFGNVSTGEFIFPATWSAPQGDYKHPLNDYANILRLFYNTYEQDIQQRYRDLRQSQAITPEQIHTYLDEWYNAIGADYYSSEYTKWSNSLCIRPTICNPNWAMVADWTGFGSTVKEYNPNYTYHAGDRCCTGICIFEATATTTGVFPYQQLGYVDSLQRYKDWVTERIRLLDEWWECTTDVLPIRSNITPANRKYYNLLGMEVQETTPGIVISNDGKKIINL